MQCTPEEISPRFGDEFVDESPSDGLITAAPPPGIRAMATAFAGRLLVASGALVALVAVALYLSPGVVGSPAASAGLSTGAELGLYSQCYVEYTGGPVNECFCQLAGNSGCASSFCACPQGCGPNTATRSEQAVTFKNKAQAVNCDEPTALLTISKSYFSTIQSLQMSCPDGMRSILQEMLVDGYVTYKATTGKERALQCIHSAGHVTTPWLHLHTFCEGGQVDNIPSNPIVAWCKGMGSPAEAASLAEEAAQWAQGLYGGGMEVGAPPFGVSQSLGTPQQFGQSNSYSVFG